MLLFASVVSGLVAFRDISRGLVMSCTLKTCYCWRQEHH